MKNTITELKEFNIFGDKCVSIEFKSQFTFITGSNGSGKSALLFAIQNIDFSHLLLPTFHDDNTAIRAINSCNRNNKLKNLVNKYIKNVDLSEKGSISKLSRGQINVLCMAYYVYSQKVSPLILIDEPEASLHVSWQKTLITDLVAIAPNAQFIIATHSPAIIGDNWDSIINLDDEGDKIYDN